MTGRGGRWVVAAALLLLQAAAYVVQSDRERDLAANPLRLRVEDPTTGEARTLASLARDRPLLLVFWTTWCAYCAEDLSRGAELARRLAAGPAPVETLFVGVREHRAAVVRHPPAAAVLDRVAADPTGEVAERLGVRGYPAHVLLDRRGEVLWSHAGLGADVAAEVASRVRIEDRR